jgi:dTDP-4-amino-4,6-dideoxygalactose transaminase
MKVPILDPARCNAQFMGELEEAAIRVLRSGKYILGEEVEAFEKACAEYLGCKYAIAVSSGTDALVLSLMTLGIGPGDEVICPSFTFFATAGAISRVGAKPVFVDILPECFTCDPEDIRRKITDKTKAIIPVHLFGQSADMEVIVDIANEHKLHIIEDAAQAIGCEYGGYFRGSLVGNVGLGCFSFFPSKNLGGFGDGGLVTTNDDAVAQELKIMRVHGGKEVYKHSRIGGNFRLDALQCSLLNVKLKYLPDMESMRECNAEFYQDNLRKLRDYIVVPKVVRGYHVWNQFTIRVKNGRRDELKNYLQSKGVSTGVYYPLPLHKQVCFVDIVPEGLSLPETELASQEVLSLPIASELRTDEIMYVIDSIKEFLSSGK